MSIYTKRHQKEGNSLLNNFKRVILSGQQVFELAMAPPHIDIAKESGRSWQRKLHVYFLFLFPISWNLNSLPTKIVDKQ